MLSFARHASQPIPNGISLQLESYVESNVGIIRLGCVCTKVWQGTESSPQMLTHVYKGSKAVTSWQ